MVQRLLLFSIRRRWLVLAATGVLALVGLWSLRRLPIDAVPDITNVQVQINTPAPGYAPVEVEQRVTFPIETALAGLPRLDGIRSLSRYGLSQVTIVFQDGTDVYFARQLVNERVQAARDALPPGLEPTLGPIATGLGEIFMWTVEAVPGAPHTPTDLRTVQDWIVRPQLLTVPGVTEVNSIGGYERQLHVTPRSDALVSYGVTFDDLLAALARNNDTSGAGYIEHAGAQYLVRAPGRITGADDVRRIPVRTAGGVPVTIGQVAEVGPGAELRTGAATENGAEVVLGTVFMRTGENSRIVSRAVAARLAEVNRTLPDGVVARTVYDRTTLVDATIRTVTTNLVEGALLVIAVLLAFLGNLRAALITAMVIPLAMLFTVTGMVANRISANLMSLGALDFGLIVDGAVIVVENCVRRLGVARHALGRPPTRDERLRIVADATAEVRQATMYGELIIMIVYLPILTLTGVEGKMFFPMAFTVVLALLGAMLLSLTFVPAAVAVALSAPHREHAGARFAVLERAYRDVLLAAFRHGRVVLAAAAAAVLAAVWLATRLGTEFIPSLDEGDIAMHALRAPSTSLSQSVAMQTALERRIRNIPEVDTVFSKIGTAEIANDPMPPSVADTFVMLKPRDAWPQPRKPKADVVAALATTVEALPGNAYEFTQPIQMRFNELIAGVRSDVAVKVFGDEMPILLATARRIAGVLGGVPGAQDVEVEQAAGLPVLTVAIDRTAVARYGLALADVQDVVAIAVGGRSAGQVLDGDRRYDLVVRLAEALRGDVEALERLPIPLPDPNGRGPRWVPLGALATLEVVTGPNQVSRENGKRRVVVTANVRGRDLGSFVADAQARVAARVAVPAGYWTTWGGQFEQLLSAGRRLRIVVPLALLSIAGLLYVSFGNLRDAALVYTGVPLALTGGVAALWLRGIPLSISAAVGFIALSGVAVLNGLVMVSSVNALRAAGAAPIDAVVRGAVGRLRPVLMTALVAALGFVPMAMATGRGAEVQRPLATVVIGGVLSSTLLTLVVLPVLCRGRRAARRRFTDSIPSGTRARE